MIKFKKWYWVLLSSILSVALWTTVSLSTDMFYENEKLQQLWYFGSYVMIIGIWLLTSLDLGITERIKKIVTPILFGLTPFFCMQISMILIGNAEFSIGIYFINVLFYAALMAIILAISRDFSWAAAITVVITYIFNTATSVIYDFRGTPLVPSDFLAVGTAAHVAGNYTFELYYQLIVTFLMTVAALVLLYVFHHKLTFKWRNIILPASGVAAALIFFVSMSLADYSEIDMDFFDQNHANNTHGSAYSFYINARRMILHKPDNYDETAVAALLDDNDNTADIVTAVTDMPNIIVIMNESFADLSVIGDFETETDYMPFFRSMKKNTIKGQLLVSPFGGNTCNTEFEFLTGLSMGLLPSGSTPYLQYVTRTFPMSLPSHLRDLGYTTSAVHPYYEVCWNRNKVYNLLGFDEFISLENLDKYVPESDWEYVRGYLSDNTSYKAVTSRLEMKKAEERLFIFNVTIQNHGGYTYDKLAFEGLPITSMNGSYPAAEQYLALIRESDSAFEELIKYLKDYDEPTIVVMFGDHQPAVEEEFFEELYGRKLSELTAEEMQRRYTVPFVIWANYDIESRDGVLTSPNYLSNWMLDAANIPKNALGDITSEISWTIPQINAMGHFDGDGYWHTNDPDESEYISEYNNIEYYLLTKK